MAHIAIVVEGDGDEEAVPILLRKYIQEIRGRYDVLLGRPINTHGRSKLLREDALERYVRLAAQQPGAFAVLVVCDADKDLPCVLGPTMLARALPFATPKPVLVALAVAEFENWIVASAESVAEQSLGNLDYESVKAVETIRGWLEPKKYKKSVHQARLAHKVDLVLARSRARSLDRFLDRIDGLLDQAPSPPA